jgi:hypothetical protein
MHIKTSIMLALLVAASCASVSLDGQWEYRSSYIDGSLDYLGAVNITGASGSYMDRGNIYALNGKSSFDGRVWIGSANGGASGEISFMLSVGGNSFTSCNNDGGHVGTYWVGVRKGSAPN